MPEKVKPQPPSAASDTSKVVFYKKIKYNVGPPSAGVVFAQKRKAKQDSVVKAYSEKHKAEEEVLKKKAAQNKK